MAQVVQRIGVCSYTDNADSRRTLFICGKAAPRGVRLPKSAALAAAAGIAFRSACKIVASAAEGKLHKDRSKLRCR